MRQRATTSLVRRTRVIAIALAMGLGLASCSSSSESDANSSAASSSSVPAADSGSATTTTPAPASTAQQPVASYPADPAADPVVDLGPPPPAYQAPRPECPVEAKACVDLTNSMTWLQVNGTVIYGPVQGIGGRDGYRTTPGMHQVIWKDIDHVSSEFGEAMPYTIFFTTTGIAFHQGPLTTPSHGCVHLTEQDAAVYWNNLNLGDQVFVFGEAQY